MKRVPIPLLLALAALVLVGIYLAVKGGGGAASSTVPSGPGDNLILPGFPVNEVAAFTIRSGDESVTLEKTDGGWVVAERGGFPANEDQVVRLLKSVWSLEAVQTVAADPSHFGRLGVEDSSGAAMLMDFRSAGGESLAGLLAGDEYYPESRPASPMGGMPAFGRYYRVPGGEAVYLAADTLGNPLPDPAAWLDKGRFLKIGDVVSVEVDFPDGELEDWTATKDAEDGGFAMAGLKDDQKADDTELDRLGTILSNPTFNDVQPWDTEGPPPPSMENAVIAGIHTSGSADYVLHIGEESGNNERPVRFEVVRKNGTRPDDPASQAATASDGEDEAEHGREPEASPPWEPGDYLYVMPSWQLDPLASRRSTLLVEDEPEETAAE